MGEYGKVNTINMTWKMAEEVWVAATLTLSVSVMECTDKIAMGTLRIVMV